jgi:hypothetical protein
MTKIEQIKSDDTFILHLFMLITTDQLDLARELLNRPEYQEAVMQTALVDPMVITLYAEGELPPPPSLSLEVESARRPGL